MIISPPFLVARNPDETDEAWIARCMVGGQPGDGAFPISHAMQWHGGMHLTAPQSNAAVRAIADGDVVFVRPPVAQPAGPLPVDHAQTYRGGWTDNGVVVLRHQTEIGEGVNATVTFFSIYMHLRQIEPAILISRRVHRETAIGLPGQVYGQNGKLHFEIVCDDANLARLTGRANGELNTAAHGRTDAVYGEMYFYMPAGAQVFDQQPLRNNPVAHRQPARPAGAAQNAPLPAPVALQAIHTTPDALIVGLRYASGEGVAANRGDAYVTTYQVHGAQIGVALEENNAEYNLYTSATAISAAYPANTRPAPSAVYELLRFGRVIGPDALNPVDVPHWRQIQYPGGTGWVNLNATSINKFSDADFPGWKQWRLVDDSADQDSRVDSPTVKGWLDVNADGSVTPAEALARMAVPEVAQKLARAICKFPTEWNAATFDARLGWLKTATLENPTPLDATNFERLRAHVTALTFLPSDAGLPDSHWHWNPKEFIGWFRRCGWIDESFMQRIYPNATLANIQLYRLALNKCQRKYLLLSDFRVAHFYGQAAVESAQFRFMSELFNGNAFDYFRHYAKARNFPGWLGNVEWNDGGNFRGRGFKQMTGRDNYANYWVYRGWLQSDSFSPRWWRNPGWWGIQGVTVAANQYNMLPTQEAATVATLTATMRPPIIALPDTVSTDYFTCIDTAGWFWAKNVLIRTADTHDVAQMTRLIRGDGAAVGVTQPWPVAAHFPARQTQTNRIAIILGEEA